MLRRVMLALACGAFLGACASTESPEGAVYQEKLYRTGSNIPKREGNMPDHVETSTVSTGDTRLGPPNMPKPMPGGR